MLRLQRALLHDYRGMNMTKTNTARKAEATAAAMISVCTVTMKFKKETPGTYVYEATDDMFVNGEPAMITTLYIRKAAMERKNGNVGPLKAILLTVEG